MRNPGVLGVWGPNGTRVLAAEATWREPLKWERAAAQNNRPTLVFCASLADVFEDWTGPMLDSHEQPLWRYESTPPQGSPFNLNQDGSALPYTMNDARARLWWLIRQTPHLRWQLLTKRPENIPAMMPHGEWPNVWLGTTVESQAYTWRMDALKEAPQTVPVRFISVEPQLGPLDVWNTLPGIDWVIIGGESGGNARELNLNWTRALILQCRDNLIPVLVKQLGKCPVESPLVAATYDVGRYPLNLTVDPGHGGNMAEWPMDLRFREFPLCHVGGAA